MNQWERAGGARLWKPPLLEASGELSVDSPGISSIRGRGLVAIVPGDSNGVGSIHWLVTSTWRSKPRTGVVFGNWMKGHTLRNDVFVVRYGNHLDSHDVTGLQLAFKGPAAGRIAQFAAEFDAAWKQHNAALEQSNARQRAEASHEGRALSDDEMAAAVARFGAIEVLHEHHGPEVDEGSQSHSCGFHMERALQNAPCLELSAHYFMEGLEEKRIADGGDPSDHVSIFTVCARCLRMEVEFNGQR